VFVVIIKLNNTINIMIEYKYLNINGILLLYLSTLSFFTNVLNIIIFYNNDDNNNNLIKIKVDNIMFSILDNRA